VAVGYSAAVQLSEIDTTFFAVSRVMSFSSCFCAEAIVELLLCVDDETPDELDELVLSESSDDELEDGDVDEDEDAGAYVELDELGEVADEDAPPIASVVPVTVTLRFRFFLKSAELAADADADRT
jgi:hypothetical protein